MKAGPHWVLSLSLVACSAAAGQITRTTVPLGDAVDQALAKGSLMYGETRPFHILVSITEPENPQSPYQATIEEWWISADQWRREVTGKDGLHQTIVVSGGNKTEKDEGDYFPLWLRNFETAIFDPIPNPGAWKMTGAVIEHAPMPNGARSQPNVRAQFKIGTGDRATDAFSNLSFDSSGRLSFYGTPRYSMEFHDYKEFGEKQIPRKLVEDPEPGTTLVGEVVVLEEPLAADRSDKFIPLPTSDDRLQSVAANSQQMEQLTEANPPIQWPTVRSGNTHGHLAMYISADSAGNVREAWPLNSDNAGLEDPAREQVRKWKLKPAVDRSGRPIAVDGGLAFVFDTRIADPLPTITGVQIDAISSGCGYKPILAPGLLPSGSSFKIRVGVNEQGKLTGESFPQDVPWDVIQKAELHTMNCRFKPYLVNGKATYYAVEFVFTAP